MKQNITKSKFSHTLMMFALPYSPLCEAIHLDYEWSKRGWFAKGLDFEWCLKSGSPSHLWKGP